MAGNADQLKQGYERFGNGDIEGAVENWTDDFTCSARTSSSRTVTRSWSWGTRT